MPAKPITQKDKALALLGQRGMVRTREFADEGVAAATLARMKTEGLVVQLGRGLYQLSDAPLDTHQSLAEAAKRVPRGVICLVSALAFHELTDTIPTRTWIAIGHKDWSPTVAYPPLHVVHFPPDSLSHGVQKHLIAGVQVPIYNPARTIIDLFRYRRSGGHRWRDSPGLNIAIEGLRQALQKRKTTPAEIARYARDGGVWKVVQPYLDAMTVNA